MTSRQTHAVYRVRRGDGCYLYRVGAGYYAWTPNREQAKCFRHAGWAARAASRYAGAGVEVGTSYERLEERQR